MKRTSIALAAVALVTSAAWAKIPPPPPAAPPTEAQKTAAEEKKKKDADAAAKAKADQANAEDRAVKSFQANMKKTGKPIPKPTPIVAAAAPPPAPAKAGAPAAPAKAGAPAAPAKAPEKAPKK